MPLGGGAPPSRVPGVNAPPFDTSSRLQIAERIRPEGGKTTSASVFIMYSCFEHSNFLKVNVPNSAPHESSANTFLQKDVKAEPDTHPEGGPVILNRNPTTSCLTATTLRAGTTAAAGTRLALQSCVALHSTRCIAKCILENDRHCMCAPTSTRHTGSNARLIPQLLHVLVARIVPWSN